MESSDEQEEGDTQKTTYMWNSMDEEDRTDTMNNLDQSDRWWRGGGNGVWVFHSPRQDGGVIKENNSPISRSVEDSPSEYTQLPIELLTT